MAQSIIFAQRNAKDISGGRRKSLTGLEVDCVRWEVGDRSKEIVNVLRIIKRFSEKEVEIRKLLHEIFVKNVPNSDLFFIILDCLKKLGKIEGKRGKVRILKLEEGDLVKVKEIVKRRIARIKKIFVTPLEVSKFFQCPRRLWLEKIVLSKQFKEEKGKVWDGEVIHLAVKLFVSRLKRLSLEENLKRSAREAIKKFEGKTVEIKESDLVEFLKSLYGFFIEENFSEIYPEKFLESFKIGLDGTPDLICFRNDGSIVTIDIKAGKLGKDIKKEHLLQSIGEALLVENFFRREVSECVLVYYGSKILVKVEITERMKKEFLNLKRKIEETYRSQRVPPKSKLPNFRRRVCKGCHVRPACENLEKVMKLRIYRGNKGR